jgi:hypothetical protein
MLLLNLFILAKVASSRLGLFPPQCQQEPVPEIPAIWPNRLGPEPWKMYGDSDFNHQLCTGGGISPNLDCICAPNGPPTGALNCNPPPGWSYTESLALIFWCKRVCVCVPPENGDDDAGHVDPVYWDGIRIDLSYPRTNRRPSASTQAQGSSNCGSGCTSFDGCGTARTRPGCKKAVCQTKQQNVGYFGIGTCSSMARSFFGGGKRDLEGPACACNATYVSASCCHADGGRVHEDLRAKLGEISLES